MTDVDAIRDLIKRLRDAGDNNMCMDDTTYCGVADDGADGLELLLERIEKLRTALKFYAARNCYWINLGFVNPAVVADGGDVARAALEADHA